MDDGEQQNECSNQGYSKVQCESRHFSDRIAESEICSHQAAHPLICQEMWSEEDLRTTYRGIPAHDQDIFGE